MPEPHRATVDVFLLLTDADRVLLARRANTGYADGLWNLPSGKVDEGEHIGEAVLREAREEIGVKLAPADVRAVAVLHHRPPGGTGRVGFFFQTPLRPERHGEPVNAEPHKCSELGWFPLAELPADTVPYTGAGVELYRTGRSFGIHGWEPGDSGPHLL